MTHLLKYCGLILAYEVVVFGNFFSRFVLAAMDYSIGTLKPNLPILLGALLHQLYGNVAHGNHVAFHLGVPKDVCKVAEEFREWVHGSFNACIPVYINDSVKFHTKKVFIKFPLPYKVGELQHPGKIRFGSLTISLTYEVKTILLIAFQRF
jgi:hypothetical protein